MGREKKKRGRKGGGGGGGKKTEEVLSRQKVKVNNKKYEVALI